MRYELSDYEWRVIKPMLPNKSRGIPRVGERRILNGIFWVLRLGATWRDLPEIYGADPDRRSCSRMEALQSTADRVLRIPQQHFSYPHAKLRRQTDIIDARLWFVQMVVKDYASELEQLDRDLETELSR